MKFIIILALAFCAVTVNSIPTPRHINDNLAEIPISYQLDFITQDGIIQTLIKIIETLVKKTQEYLQQILDKLESILRSINNSIQAIIDESKAFIDSISNGTVKKLDEIAKQNAISKQCVENVRPNLDVAVAEHSLELQSCQQNAIEQAQNIRNDIQPYIESIRDNIDALEDIVSECLETTGTPLKLIGCIAKQTDDIKSQLFDMCNNALKVISTGPKRAIEIAQDTRSCAKKSNDKFQIAMEGIIDNVKQCIKTDNNKPKPELLL